ncbi:Beta-ketoacyl synthase [Metarhizium album ARSEF 1941]|uniref:Beta-ketoacyl synthase n=1 Tax=Metarhizium album (strain ARSEF 1941) TaxID=1081103 RepID=A0A0B2WL22_METAS|nr:Beta-ketoacyl synthase [Metarhizium album ARSEF 1941]KHN94379.1 Beta-ketoacyl synthase [Metarhizium album ARSEF 1941]
MRAPAPKRHDVAVIGISCHFPCGADTADQFWDFICNGRTLYSEDIDGSATHAVHSYDKEINIDLIPGGHTTKRHVASLDASFCNLSNAEAESMDLQQRIIMEATYESIESAGLEVGQLAGSRTGVFIGSVTSDYRQMPHHHAETVPLYNLTGASNTPTSDHISWFFDLRGPSVTTNATYSSSLVACHLACQSLWSGESEIAIVGGTNLLLNPDMFLCCHNRQALAPKDKRKSLDESRGGYSRGDGVGVVILKRVADAVRDADPIRAVIRGSGCNRDGHTKEFTTPDVEAQTSLIVETYHSAGLSLAETRYVEAHGAPISLGDAPEMEGIARAFSPRRVASDKLLVGSIKSSVGHLATCAGLASLIKSVYILETGVIPPTQCACDVKPKVRCEEWHLKVPTTKAPWPAEGLRRISTHGFGYGGTNAHLILDDAAHYLEARNLRGHHYTRIRPQPQRLSTSAAYREEPKVNPPRLFLFQASNREGLGRLRASLAQHLSQRLKSWPEDSRDSAVHLQKIAFALASRRSHINWRTYAVASTLEELLNVLKHGERAWATPEVRGAATSLRLGFVFTGQGAHWARMGLDLMVYPVFRQSVEESDRFLREALGCSWSAVDELAKPQTASRLAEAAYSQTLCTVLQIAVVDLLEDWNISPTRVVGHSSGEIAAAYCLGALTKHDGLRVAYYRGILSSEMRQSQQDQRGAMLAIGASRGRVEEWLAQLTRGKVVVACINSPTSVTASGDEEGNDELLSMVQRAGVFGRKLQVNVAYHCHHMESLSTAYAELLKQLEPLQARKGRAMHSSVLGGVIEAAELGAAYWVRNLVSLVRFSEAVSSLISHEDRPAVDVLVEIGPHPALKGPVQEILHAQGVSAVKYMCVISRGRGGGVKSALTLAGELVLSNVPVEIGHVNLDTDLPPSLLMDLPPCLWNCSARSRAKNRLSKDYRLRRHAHLPLLRNSRLTTCGSERCWRGVVTLQDSPWIRDHQIQGSILYPSTVFLTMAIEAASNKANENRKMSALRVTGVHFDDALMVTEDSTTEAILRLRTLPLPAASSQSPWMEFTVSSSIEGGVLRQNCAGLIMIEYEIDADPFVDSGRTLESDMVRDGYKKTDSSCRQSVELGKLYSRLAPLGPDYGTTFANMTEIRKTGEGQCIGTVRLVPPAHESHPRLIHPGTLDAVFQLAFAALEDSLLLGPMVPSKIDEVVIAAEIPNSLGALLHGVPQSSLHDPRELVSDIDMLDDESSRVVVQIKGLRWADVSGGRITPAAAASSETRPIGFRVERKPAADLLAGEQLQTYVGRLAEQGDVPNLARAATLNNHVGRLATCRSAQAAGISTPFYFDDPRFSILAQPRDSDVASSSTSDAGDGSAGEVSVRTQLSQAQSVAEAVAAIQAALLERVARTLQIALLDIDPSKPLHSYGVDSLVAVETVKWTIKTLDAKLTVFDLLSNEPVTALCEKIASISTLVKLTS